MKRIDTVNARADVNGVVKKAFMIMRMFLVKMQPILIQLGVTMFRKK
jgi:hypothetical protein